MNDQQPKFLLWISPMVLLLGVAGAPLFAQTPWTVYVPLAFGLLLFALPHGALDHLVAQAMLRKLERPQNLPTIYLAYVALALIFGSLWFVSPPFALILFLALTIYHWGSGDLWPLHQPMRSSLNRLVAILICGGIPIGFPFLFQPIATREIVSATLSLFGSHQSISGPMAFGTACGVIACLSILLGVYQLVSHHSPYRKGGREIVELVILGVAFAMLHPLVSIGLYFCFWHGFRHLLRLTQAPPFRDYFTDHSWVAALTYISLRAIPLTLVSLVVLAAIALMMPTYDPTPNQLVGLYLVALSMITFPHAIIVELIDGWKPTWLARQNAVPEVDNPKTYNTY